MNTPENPYRYEPSNAYPRRGCCDDHSCSCCVIRIPHDPENPGSRERSIGRSLLIVFCVHFAVIAPIFIYHNWQVLIIDFLDLISKFRSNV